MSMLTVRLSELAGPGRPLLADAADQRWPVALLVGCRPVVAGEAGPLPVAGRSLGRPASQRRARQAETHVQPGSRIQSSGH